MAYADEYKGNIYENWIVRLYYDAEGSNDWTGISTDTYSTYHPIISNKPTIRRSIDLANSKANTGNISLKLINFDYQGSPFSEELLGGSRKYINRKVKVYSRLINSSLIIYTGRLVDISHDLDSISLKITDKRPSDFISIPNKTTTTTKKYFPIAYGNFVQETSSASSPQFCTSAIVFPAVVDKVVDGQIKVLTHEDANITAGTRGHHHEKNEDLFIPYDPADDTAEAYEGGYAINVPLGLKRAWKSQTIVESDTNEFNNFANLTSTTLFTDITQYIPNQGQNEQEHDINVLDFEIGKPDGRITQIEVSFDYELQKGATLLHSGTNKVYLRDRSNGANNEILNKNLSSMGGSGSPTTGSDSFTIENPSSFTGKISIESDLSIVGLSTGSSYATTYTRINNVVIAITCEGDYDAEPEALGKVVGDLVVYQGSNGLVESWNVGNIATKVHTIHRDLLYRFTGYTAEPDNWGDSLNGIMAQDDGRGSWSCRWWASEPIELEKVLEKIQLEGCFIFLWNPSGEGKYVFVNINGYSSGDESETLTENDISKITISKSPFSELLTKMEVKHSKHPSGKTYQESSSYENSTARSDWNIGTKENIKEVELDILKNTTTGGADSVVGFWDYYNNIYGNVKIQVKCNIVNPAKMDLDVGDIVKFDLDIKPFGYDWTQYYMITSLTRKIGEMSIECREVG